MAQHLYLLCFFFLSLSLSFALSISQAVPAIFVFGDSLVDVGNNNHLPLSVAKADFPHNGVDFPGRKPTGRFSNGKNAADFIALKLGLPTSPPYLSVASASNKTEAFLKGVSFASGGAGILDGTDKLFRQSLTFNKQIEYFTTVQGELVRQLGAQAVQDYLSKSLIVIVIGSNDILGYFSSGSSRPAKSNPQQFVDSLTVSLKDQLKKIYDLGARKFFIAGVAATGCVPSQRNQNKTGGCNEETNYWSGRLNEGVKHLLQGMESELKDLKYSYFDAFSLILQFIQKPSNYGFVEVKSACCGLGNNNAKIACIPISKYCPNRRDHVFWDLYHPTEAVSSMFADTIVDGPQQYTFPINVRQLVTMS
ncbi:hypothetical protein Sjap_003159 [Stephania japonica]|uniref:GDSL esterase/lipase n=1 Tax=Stephania japonica TaxID=461633 RepID=A0AAP0PV70_9MAGN